MKKPIVGVQKGHYTVWTLPNGVDLRMLAEHKTILEFEYRGESIGTIYRDSAQELFQVILYPPGSVPSPESADPTDKHRMKMVRERQWDIPRADILDNGDWY